MLGVGDGSTLVEGEDPGLAVSRLSPGLGLGSDSPPTDWPRRQAEPP